MGDERGRPDRGSDPAREARWAAAAEDLSGDYNLRGCPSARFAGGERPSLGRNVLLARLGSGGMGVVYHAVNPRLGSEVAVKVLPPALLELQGVLADRLQREAQLAAQVDSPHLVRVLDVDHDEGSGCHFIVMEFVDGPTAAAWAEKKAPSERDVLRLGLAAANGLAAAHREGIVHRDVKPGNLLLPLGEDGLPDPERVKVADLGLARTMSPGADITRTAAAMGTPGFMAPEQIRDSRGAGKSADVFGLGATLYALLTGSPPFDGETPADALVRTSHGAYAALETVRSDLGPATRVLVHKCLERRPAERFPDGAALARALELALDALGASDGAVDAARLSISSLTGAPEEGLPVLAVPTPEPADTRGVPIGRPVPTERPFWAVILVGLVLIVAATMLAPGFGIGPKVLAAAVFVCVVIVAVAMLARQGRSASSVPTPASADTGGRTPAVTIMLRVALIGGAMATLVFVGTLLKVSGGPGAPTGAPTLFVTSHPVGAVVTVDGSRRGITPVQVGGLSPGNHEIVLTKDYFETTSESAHVPANGQSTHRTTLDPAKTRFSIVGGGGPGSVRLIRNVPSPIEFGFNVGTDGSYDEVDTPCGEYEWIWFPGNGPSRGGTIILRADAVGVLDLGGRAGTGLISISTEPPGAEVLLDDVVIGTTPLTAYRAEAGFHVVTLRLRHHEDHRFKMTLDQDEHERLQSATLTPWGVLTLAGIDDDVVAFHEGRRLGESTPLPPRSQTVVLKRTGYADQEVVVVVPLATVRPLGLRTWSDYRALLDLSLVPNDIDVQLDGAPVRGVHTSPTAIVGTLTFTKQGIPATTIPLDVKLGATWQAQADDWEGVLGRLVFPDLGSRVRFEVDGAARAGEMFAEPGDHAVAAFLERALPVVLPVRVTSGETTVVPRPRWKRAEGCLPLRVVSSDGPLLLGPQSIRPTPHAPLFLRSGDEITAAEDFTVEAFGGLVSVTGGLTVQEGEEALQLQPRGGLSFGEAVRIDRRVRLYNTAVSVDLPVGWRGACLLAEDQFGAMLTPVSGVARVQAGGFECELVSGTNVSVAVLRTNRPNLTMQSRGTTGPDVVWTGEHRSRSVSVTFPAGATGSIERLEDGRLQVSCDISSSHDGKLLLRTKGNDGEPSVAPIGPGAAAILE